MSAFFSFGEWYGVSCVAIDVFIRLQVQPIVKLIGLLGKDVQYGHGVAVPHAR